MSRAALRSILALAGMTGLMTTGLLQAAAAGAAQPCVESPDASTVTCTYEDTGAELAFLVPDGVTSLEVAVRDGDSQPEAVVAPSTQLTVTPGSTLVIDLGDADEVISPTAPDAWDDEATTAGERIRTPWWHVAPGKGAAALIHVAAPQEVRVPEPGMPGPLDDAPVEAVAPTQAALAGTPDEVAAPLEDVLAPSSEQVAEPADEAAVGATDPISVALTYAVPTPGTGSAEQSAEAPADTTPAAETPAKPEAPVLTETTAPAEASAPAEMPAPAASENAVPTETTPTETTPTETAPAEAPAPVEETAPVEESAPVEVPEETAPEQTPAPVETPEPVESPAPEQAAAAVETPAEAPAAAETPASTEAPTPAETPAAEPAPAAETWAPVVGQPETESPPRRAVPTPAATPSWAAVPEPEAELPAHEQVVDLQTASSIVPTGVFDADGVGILASGLVGVVVLGLTVTVAVGARRRDD